MLKEKDILYADYDLEKVIDGRRSMDVAGHYSRPDIFKFAVNKSPMDVISFE